MCFLKTLASVGLMMTLGAACKSAENDDSVAKFDIIGNNQQEVFVAEIYPVQKVGTLEQLIREVSGKEICLGYTRNSGSNERFGPAIWFISAKSPCEVDQKIEDPAAISYFPRGSWIESQKVGRYFRSVNYGSTTIGQLGYIPRYITHLVQLCSQDYDKVCRLNLKGNKPIIEFPPYINNRRS